MVDSLRSIDGKLVIENPSFSITCALFRMFGIEKQIIEKYKPADHQSYEYYLIESNVDKGRVDFWYRIYMTKDETVALIKKISDDLHLDLGKVDSIIGKVNEKHGNLFMPGCVVSDILSNDGLLKPMYDFLAPVKNEDPVSVSFSSVNGLLENWNEILYMYHRELTVSQLLDDLKQRGEVTRDAR